MDASVESKDSGLFNRDEVLSEVGNLLEIKEEGGRAEKTAEFIENRLKTLTESTIPSEFSIMTRPKKGFLHPESGIRRNFMVDPFHVDDPEIYKLLMKTFAEYRTHSGWQNKTIREIAPSAIQRTIGAYFGNEWGSDSTETNNRQFYLDHTVSDSDDIHLGELKGKGIAVCAEKAAVAQNLLSFLGYESELVASPKCRLESLEEDGRGGHLYNVIKSGENRFIFDPTNPILVTNDDKKVHSVMPAFYPLDQSNYQKLMQGGQVEVAHPTASWDGKQISKDSEDKRIYGGPSKATLI